MSLHAVLINNRIPLEEARKKAQEFIKDKKKKYYRETKNQYRFRNISKQKFKPKSFYSKKLNNDVVLVFGELKDEWKHLKGSGILDVIKDPIGTIKEAFAGVPTKYNNISRRTLEQYGNEIIQTLKIARTPLNPTLPILINTISLGKWNELTKKYGFDTLYHLSLIVNDKIIIEKNETITIEPLTSSKSIKSNTEFFNIIPNTPRTINQLMENTRKFMGDEKFFDYSALKNNCQVFVQSVLESNLFYTPEAKKFLFQDFTQFTNDLNQSGYSYVPAVMQKITDLGSIVSRLSGKGTETIALNQFENYLKRYHLTPSDTKAITKEFVNFINREGLKFI